MSEIDRNLATHSKHNWEIRLVEYYPEPQRDYTPDPAGTEWEAVLLHEVSSSETLETAWQQIVQWSAPTGQGIPRKLHVNYNGEKPVSEKHDAKEAFEVFLSGRARVQGSGYDQCPIQVVGFARVPFRMWYGEALDQIQVWFEENRIVLIVADRHAETGLVDWDLENFVEFHALVQAVSSRVGAKKFAWWLSADSAEDSDVLAIDKLNDPETLWGIFSGLATAERPLDRTRFDALFASSSSET